jgi:hypothetical protein
MRLTVANISTAIAAGEFAAALRAIEHQVRSDFQPEWSVAATLSGVALDLAAADAPIQDHGDAVIYVGERSQDPTTGVDEAIGYHDTNHRDVPYGFVFLDVCARQHEVWTTTLSHEVLELLADPRAEKSVPGVHPKIPGRPVRFDLEVCDPTQGDSYLVDGVRVSNFVGRSYFGLVGGSGRTNFLGLELAPFGVRRNGYVQYEDGKKAHQVYGEAVTPDMLAAKALLKTGRRNARRVARLAG